MSGWAPPADFDPLPQNLADLFVLIGESLKMLFEQKLEDIDSARLVQSLRARGELKG